MKAIIIKLWGWFITVGELIPVVWIESMWRWALQDEKLIHRGICFQEGLLASRNCSSFLYNRQSSSQGEGLGRHLYLQAGLWLHCRGAGCGTVFFRDP